MEFDKLVNLILSETYKFVGNCIDYCGDDGNEIYKIVKQDDLTFGAETLFHDPELEISKEKFETLTGIKVPDNHFTGYNKDYDIVFDYNPKTDIHNFYKK